MGSSLNEVEEKTERNGKRLSAIFKLLQINIYDYKIFEK